MEGAISLYGLFLIGGCGVEHARTINHGSAPYKKAIADKLQVIGVCHVDFYAAIARVQITGDPILRCVYCCDIDLHGDVFVATVQAVAANTVEQQPVLDVW